MYSHYSSDRTNTRKTDYYSSSLQKPHSYQNYASYTAKPHYNYYNTRTLSTRNKYKSDFCFHCNMLHPCFCDSGTYNDYHHSTPRYDYESDLPSMDSCKAPSCNYRQHCVSPSDTNEGAESLATCDYGQNDEPCTEHLSACDSGVNDPERCLICKSSLIPPSCACGKSTYCKQCKEITPCDRCPSAENTWGSPKCSKCTCTLMSPRCPCGKPMYCVHCEKLIPCDCEQYKLQPKCDACGNMLTSPCCTCGEPTYCWQCEAKTICRVCSGSSGEIICLDNEKNRCPQPSYTASTNCKSKGKKIRKCCKTSCYSLEELMKPGSKKLIVKEVQRSGRSNQPRSSVQKFILHYLSSE